MEEADLIAHPRWLGELAYLTDITEHLNILNVKLQGKEKSDLRYVCYFESIFV